MASNPRNWAEEQDEVEESFQPAQGHRLPGWTVDSLLEQGKEDEAREELENLLLAGINSGPGRVADDAYLEEVIAEILSGARPEAK
jgi:hypothetical protein